MISRLLKFLSGFIVTIFAISLLLTVAVATNRLTIEVDPINIQVNGEVFQPKDVNGNDVPVFAYNGTTYAPLRALAEAYGLDVWYDATSNLAAVGPKGSAPTPVQEPVTTQPPVPTQQPQSSQSSAPSFRNVKWGMTREEVKQNESVAPNYENDQAILYETAVAGFDAHLVYYFDDVGKLYMAAYGFEEDHSNDNLYIADYNSLVGSLSEKYGEPKSQDELWSDRLFEDNPEDYGLAIAVGHLAYTSAWETPDTDIELLLSGDNYECTIGLYYESKTYQAVNASDLEGL